MEDIFESTKLSMAAKTDEELEVYINDTEKYDVIDISTAVAELRKRSKFDESKFENILEIIRSKLGFATPTYYSQSAIFLFSITLSALCGAILFSLNLKTRKDKWVVIGFGITYTVLVITIRSIYELHPLGPLFLNALGGLILEGYIWDIYIGKNAIHKNRSILIPALIGVSILAISIALSIYFERVSTLLLILGIS